MAIVHTIIDLSPLRLAGSDALRLIGGQWSALAQATIVSLLSWRRAELDDDVPNQGEREGWWADAYLDDGDAFGSRLWLVQRNPLTNASVEAVRTYAIEALQWMITDGLAARVDVSADRVAAEISLEVNIFRKDGEREALRFPAMWSALNG